MPHVYRHHGRPKQHNIMPHLYCTHNIIEINSPWYVVSHDIASVNAQNNRCVSRGFQSFVSDLLFRLTQGELIETRIETRAIVVKRGEELNGKRVRRRRVETKRGIATRTEPVKREESQIKTRARVAKRGIETRTRGAANTYGKQT